MLATSLVQSLKLTLVSALGLSKDALHIHVGLGAFLLTALVFRLPLRSWWPWLASAALACLGEVVDMRDDLASLGRWRWQASLHDLWNTAFWPTVLFVLARCTRLLRVA